ncbi:MAG: hypothetical protein M0R75_06955 [Dehalococcoidia bacterium]|nr:hypothetical protein [Dehalococcoidia bacterium]
MPETKDMTAEELAAFRRQTALNVLREDPDLLERIGEGLLGLAERVKHGGKGKVTVTVAVVNTKKAGFSETVFVEGSVKVTEPAEPPTEQSLWYAVNGQMTRRDPRQPDLPMFKQVARNDGDEVAEEAAAQ